MDLVMVCADHRLFAGLQLINTDGFPTSQIFSHSSSLASNVMMQQIRFSLFIKLYNVEERTVKN